MELYTLWSTVFKGKLELDKLTVLFLLFSLRYSLVWGVYQDVSFEQEARFYGDADAGVAVSLDVTAETHTTA